MISHILESHIDEEFNSGRGYLHLYTGDGKGKTTAAVGLAIRCAGIGEDVIFAQFLKTGESGELNLLRRVPHVEVILPGKKFGFSWTMSPEDKKEAERTYYDYLAKILKRAQYGDYRMLILDEILDAIRLKLVDEVLFMQFLDEMPDEIEVVLTGRGPSQAMIDRAAYVTEMHKVKHPFDDGVKSRRGIEY